MTLFGLTLMRIEVIDAAIHSVSNFENHLIPREIFVSLSSDAILPARMYGRGSGFQKMSHSQMMTTLLYKIFSRAGLYSMPRGPKGEKRPADAIGNAIMIGRIATGEIEDLTTDDGKNAAAVALGRMGGKARAAGMTAKKRSDIAKKAAKKRWER
jgi:hypothetical protein